MAKKPVIISGKVTFGQFLTVFSTGAPAQKLVIRGNLPCSDGTISRLRVFASLASRIQIKCQKRSRESVQHSVQGRTRVPLVPVVIEL